VTSADGVLHRRTAGDRRNEACPRLPAPDGKWPPRSDGSDSATLTYDPRKSISEIHCAADDQTADLGAEFTRRCGGANDAKAGQVILSRRRHREPRRSTAVPTSPPFPDGSATSLVRSRGGADRRRARRASPRGEGWCADVRSRTATSRPTGRSDSDERSSQRACHARPSRRSPGDCSTSQNASGGAGESPA
jgi:hypothetical protein